MKMPKEEILRTAPLLVLSRIGARRQSLTLLILLADASEFLQPDDIFTTAKHFIEAIDVL